MYVCLWGAGRKSRYLGTWGISIHRDFPASLNPTNVAALRGINGRYPLGILAHYGLRAGSFSLEHHLTQVT